MNIRDSTLTVSLVTIPFAWFETKFPKVMSLKPCSLAAVWCCCTLLTVWQATRCHVPDFPFFVSLRLIRFCLFISARRLRIAAQRRNLIICYTCNPFCHKHARVSHYHERWMLPCVAVRHVTSKHVACWKQPLLMLCIFNIQIPVQTEMLKWFIYWLCQ